MNSSRRLGSKFTVMAVKRILILGVLIGIAFLSCKKEKTVADQIKIDETNLTVCPANTTCEYLFYENADVSIIQSEAIQEGPYRVFLAYLKNLPAITAIYVKAPMDGDRFELDDQDVMEGKLLFFNSCPVCNQIPVRVIEGYVKGVNLTPGKTYYQSKWLLEIKFLLLYGGSDGDVETVVVKQYFSPK